MPTTTRAKVLISSVSGDTAAGPNGYEAASMYGVKSDGDDPEDNAFAAATPGLSISITVSNPALFGFFKQGKKYFVDFTPVEAE